MRDRLSRPLEGRGADDGTSRRRMSPWVVFPLLVLAAVVLVVTLLFVVGSMLEPQTLAYGRQEIRAMKSDPIVGFRAPGTRSLMQEERPAARHPFGGGESTSSMYQSFATTGDATDTAEAYRLAAQANGWAFVADGCSRVERATAAVFGKRLGSFDATLVFRVALGPGQTLGANDGERGRQGLLVTLEAARAGIQSLSVDAGIHRNDLHCLRGVDPAAADLQPPTPPPLEIEELCARIPVPAAKAIAAQVEAAFFEPTGDECWLVDSSRLPLFTVKQARQPRAYYEDRRLPSTQRSTERFSFSVYGKKDPDLARAVWATTPVGSYVVGAGGALGATDGAEGPLFAVTSLLAAIDPRSTPTGRTAPVLPESGVPILIEYRLEGGFVATKRVVVTVDGEAVYTGGDGSQPVRFRVAPGTMDELRAALARVDFAKLSPSYGSPSRPEKPEEVVTYEGKIVRVASGAPSELRRVTSVLNRLLDERSRHDLRRPRPAGHAVP